MTDHAVEEVLDCIARRAAELVCEGFGPEWEDRLVAMVLTKLAADGMQSHLDHRIDRARKQINAVADLIVNRAAKDIKAVLEGDE